jgi:hypothetical protein
LTKKLLPPDGDNFRIDDLLTRAPSLSTALRAGKFLTMNVSTESILHVPVGKSYDQVLKDIRCEISAEYKITCLVESAAAQPAS